MWVSSRKKIACGKKGSKWTALVRLKPVDMPGRLDNAGVRTRGMEGNVKGWGQKSQRIRANCARFKRGSGELGRVDNQRPEKQRGLPVLGQNFSGG